MPAFFVYGTTSTLRRTLPAGMAVGHQELSILAASAGMAVGHQEL